MPEASASPRSWRIITAGCPGTGASGWVSWSLDAVVSAISASCRARPIRYRSRRVPKRAGAGSHSASRGLSRLASPYSAGRSPPWFTIGDQVVREPASMAMREPGPTISPTPTPPATVARSPAHGLSGHRARSCRSGLNIRICSTPSQPPSDIKRPCASNSQSGSGATDHYDALSSPRAPALVGSGAIAGTKRRFSRQGTLVLWLLFASPPVRSR